MYTYKVLSVLIFSLWWSLSPIWSQAQTKSNNSYTLTLKVVDEEDKESLVMASVSLKPLQANVFTDIEGVAKIENVPAGSYDLEISYIGYATYKKTVTLSGNTSLDIRMHTSSLKLQEVVVTAQQNASGSSTSSIIGRQAIDHLQAVSLADILQLVPGQTMGNTDLVSQTNLQLRTLSNNTNSAFGASIIVDGMPISNNGSLQQGGYSSTAFVGTDLRQIAADDIERVEVIRGIPSAEYGDLSSGLVVVHSQYGVTPWRVRGKINPTTQNYSVSRGFRTDRLGILNMSADYAQAWGDPRQKTRSFHRYNLSIGQSYAISSRWHIDTRVRWMQMKDWSGKDPDAIADGTDSKTRNYTLSILHNGKISMNRLWSRTLSYTVGLGLSNLYSRTSSYVSSGSGLLPIVTAVETGYFNVPWKTSSYLATGINDSKPSNVYAKLNNALFLKLGDTRQSVKMGVDYRYDWNSGKGYYNANDSLPYRVNNNGRPRPYDDIPGTHVIGAYLEDNLSWNINDVNKLRAQVGVRLTTIQPFSNVQAWAVSPRINLSFALTNWLSVRGGWGTNAKTPSLDYLYPSNKYEDRVAVNYMPQGDPTAQLLNYHTQVIEVKKSKDLKNAVTTKYELGVDFRLRNGKKLSVLAYRDKTLNGFGSSTEYMLYQSSVFTPTQGLIIAANQPTTIDYTNPERTDNIFTSTGKLGNTSASQNQGVEFDLDFGEVPAIKTSFYLSGAYSETKTWSRDINVASVRTALLPVSYTTYGLTPFKVIYPSELDYSRWRRFIATLRIVTAIPSVRMVASFATQAMLHNSSLSYGEGAKAIGWIDTNLTTHAITSSMTNGYIGLDGVYYDTMPASGDAISISDLATNSLSNTSTKTPITWNISARLSKELGNIGGLSLYVNNMLFYEPFLKSNTTNTLVQRNTGNFSFGMELYLNL